MNKLKIISFILIIWFILNLIWENAHAPLYEWFINYNNHFKMCFDASIGDAFLILTIYLLISLLLWNNNWIKNITKKEIILIFLFWIIITLIFEKYALINWRWSYNNNMAIIPFLWIWISPALQLIITPYLTFLITWKIFYNKKLWKF